MKVKHIDSYLKIGLVIVILLIGIWFLGRRSAKRNFPDYPVPKNPSSDDDLTEEERREAEQLADKLYDQLSGWNFWYDKDVYEEFLKTTDRVFIATYNIFNDKYYSKKNRTLREWMEKEYSTILQYSLGKIMNTIYERFDKFEMK